MFEIEPNWHPMIVHFVVGLLITAAVTTLVVALVSPETRWRESLRAASDWMLVFGVIATLAAITAGFQAYYTVAHDTPSHAAMTDHRNWAIATAVAILGIGIWRYLQRGKMPSLLFAVILIGMSGLLVSTAWRGGELVYRYGLGVSSLPEASGEGHDHEHEGDGHSHDTTPSSDIDDHDGDGHSHESSSAVSSDQSGEIIDFSALEPEDIAAAFRGALERKDESAVRALLLPDVFISESGGAERSMDEYASHHMPADMEFSAGVEHSVQDQRVQMSRDTAWIIAEIVSHGRFRDRDIHSRLMETMVLTQTENGWRIAHIHWSSAPIAESDHEH